MSHPTKVVEEPPHRSLNREIIIDEEYVRECLNPLQVIWNIYDITKKVLCEGEPHPYYHSMFMTIHDEKHLVIELLIVVMRMRKDNRRES